MRYRPAPHKDILKGWNYKQNIGRPSGMSMGWKLLIRLKRLKSMGFPLYPSRLQLLLIALQIHLFKSEKQQVFWDRFQRFMKKHQDKSKWKAEVLSFVRAKGMHWQEVNNNDILTLLRDSDQITKILEKRGFTGANYTDFPIKPAHS